MRPLSSLLLTLTLFALPVSAHAEGAKDTKTTKTPSAASTHAAKRKTASRAPKGAISVDRLKQEVASRIAHEKKQAEQLASKAGPAKKTFEGAVAQVKARLGKVIQDGTVTTTELKTVRESYKLMATKSAKKTPAKQTPAKQAPAKKAAAKPDPEAEELSEGRRVQAGGRGAYRCPPPSAWALQRLAEPDLGGGADAALQQGDNAPARSALDPPHRVPVGRQEAHRGRQQRVGAAGRRQGRACEGALRGPQRHAEALAELLREQGHGEGAEGPRGQGEQQARRRHQEARELPGDAARRQGR